MINRVLIRIKVVQLLYSYLLTENHFMVEAQPVSPTKEKRFAYSLYLDILSFFIKLANSIPSKSERSLKNTRFIQELENDEILRVHIIKLDNENTDPFHEQFYAIRDLIENSTLYKNFIRSSSDGEGEMIWEKIFETLIYPNPLMTTAFSSIPGYSIGGVERMHGLMTDTFRDFYTSRDNINDALKQLDLSLEKARELYMRLLCLIIDITHLRKVQLDENRHKYLPTEEDLHPDTKFIDNALVKALESDSDIEEYNKSAKISWIAEDRQLVGALLKEILDSDLYREYMDFPASDLHSDIEFWRSVFKQIIFQSEDFLEYMETKSVFWNDDLDIIGTFLLKTLKRYEDEDETSKKILPKFRDSSAEEFGGKLMKYVITNKEVYRKYINDFVISEKWDSDRIPFMDVIITMTALAEILNFPEIPLTVSLNEYIEIAKSYSSSKSGSFINGILGSIIKKLREEGKIIK